ncbi:MAG: response regulator, partial [Verrucomicrobia bacterium]|nr:response regulator [Verrucomicrobiota bacterium]
LSTVYGIIHQHGGEVLLDSEEGKGSTFTVYLPLTTAAAEKDRSEEGEVPRGNETILFVEDNPSVRKITKRMLETLGYRVLDASGFDEAMQVLSGEAGRVDLLLTDVVMPGVDGVELAGRVRELRPDIRLLFASGYPQEQLARHGIDRPDAELLKKPFDIRELGKALRRVLDGD